MPRRASFFLFFCIIGLSVPPNHSLKCHDSSWSKVLDGITASRLLELTSCFSFCASPTHPSKQASERAPREDACSCEVRSQARSFSSAFAALSCYEDIACRPPSSRNSAYVASGQLARRGQPADFVPRPALSLSPLSHLSLASLLLTPLQRPGTLYCRSASLPRTRVHALRG